MKPSLQRDVEAGSVSELESMIGIIVCLGAQLSVPTPLVRFAYRVRKHGYIKARGSR